MNIYFTEVHIQRVYTSLEIFFCRFSQFINIGGVLNLHRRLVFYSVLS